MDVFLEISAAPGPSRRRGLRWFQPVLLQADKGVTITESGNGTLRYASRESGRALSSSCC